jgi:hypothetical protein
MIPNAYQSRLPGEYRFSRECLEQELSEAVRELPKLEGRPREWELVGIMSIAAALAEREAEARRASRP